VWRWAIVLAFAWVAVSTQANAASSVYCIPSTNFTWPVSSMTYTDGRAWFTAQSTASGFPYATPTFPDTSGSPYYVRSSSFNTWVAPGMKCPAAAQFVIMRSGDYDLILDSVSVVSKLDDGYNLGTIGLAALFLIIGFWFGYKLVQRRDSQ